MATAFVEDFGRRIADSLEGFGRFTRFTIATWRWMIGSAGQWNRVTLLMPQLYHIGTRSIPVVCLVGGFVGMVLAIEAFNQFAQLGLQERLGAVIDVSVVKQIGPVLAAVMLAGRVGGSVSAELGTMRVTEQLDALRVMGADPIAYLVVPRVIACVLMIPVLTVFSDLMGIYGGYYVVVYGFGASPEPYWYYSMQFVNAFDVMTGLAKSVVFGLLIGLISCYKGFHCDSGAAGVGKAATDAFVTSFIAIIVANFILAKFLNDIFALIYGPMSRSPIG